MTLRDYLREMEADGRLIHVDEPLSPRYEIPYVIKKHDGEGPILFDEVEGFDGKVVANVCYSRESISASLGVTRDRLHEHLHHALNNPSPCRTEDGPVMEVVEDLSLHEVPVLTHYDGEQGPYITSAVVYANNPDGAGGNVSYHRMDVLDENRLSICIQPGHLARYVEQTRESGGETLDISISIGAHPAVMLAGALHPPFNVSEFDVANTLLDGGLKLCECPHVDAFAPSDAELVLEARIRVNEEALEGPYVCVTGTRKESKPQPVVEIVGSMHREDYLYQGLLAASREHRLLEGIPNEVKVWERIRDLGAAVKGVNMTPSGSSWLHCVASFEKTDEEDPRNVLMAMFDAQPALKHAVVVDSDIDPYDAGDVEWALATRFQGDKDLIIIPDSYASRLDPSSDTENRLGCKAGFDATRPPGKAEETFKKGSIPISNRVNKILRALR